MKNYYRVLGVPADANGNAIRHAFRTKARRFHPDSGAGASSERFREVMEAYETLSDPSRRRQYDRTLQSRKIKAEPLSPAPEPLQARFYAVPARQPASIFDFADEIFAEFDAYFDALWNRY